ncbi:hypothetical protein FJZ26_01950 [Candidatus Parvarchaeota archaeon]|nr:hypothetical protein [Candidatus Parvarchaeota archaeon]
MGVKKVSESLMKLDDYYVFYIGLFIGAFFAFVGLTFVTTQNLFGGVVFVLIGILTMAVVKKTTIELDKQKRTLAVKIFSLLGSKKFEYNLQQITKVQLRYLPTHSSSNDLCFILSDGNVLSYLNIVGEPTEATQISQFLGVPFETQGPPSSQQAADMMKQTAEYWGRKAAEQKKMDEKQLP